MNVFTAIDIIEGLVEGDVIEAFQALINDGVVWSLQGSYGRTAVDLINSGQCIEPDGAHFAPEAY